MKEFKVLATLKIGDNTAIVIDDKGIDLRNGIQVSDEHDNPYTILSVGITNNFINTDKTTLLIEGSFNSSKIII